MEELERAIPLCLPDNYSWDQETNECIKQSEHRSSYKLQNTALRRLEAIQGPVCVVAVAGPLRKGKSFILSQPFAGNREIFPLGHELDPKTVGLWMWVVPEMYRDTEGNEFTVVLIDTEGIDSTVADKNDDDTILTLAVLLSSVLIYNSAGVPTRSDLEGLRFVMKLSQRIQVFTGQKTTSDQAQLVFPSFIWLLRDALLNIPQDCKDLTEYFLKHVFQTTNNPHDQAQQVTDTLLNFFPSFEAFRLPLPSYDSNVVQTITHPSSQSALNPKFLKEIQKFSKVLKGKLERKRTADGKSFVTGEALSSMVESYVKTLNTPGAVPSISGAWEQYIGREGHTIYQIANAVYFNEMKERLHERLPCDSRQIRDDHTMILQHVMVNVFEVTVESKGMSAEQLAKYAEEFQSEAEDIESSWLQKNNILTENNCETVFKEVKSKILTPAKEIWKEFENQGEAEMRIRNAYESVISEFNRRCRGCKEIIDNLSVLYKEELDKEMRHDIGIVRQLGDKKDETYFRQLEREEIKELEESLKEENTQKLERRREELQGAFKKSEETLKKLRISEKYTEMASRTIKQAIPLVLPNNYSWDATTGKCDLITNVNPETIDILPQALDQLREIEGPVCVVAISGPYRKGKSYALCRAFDQEQVFPLGHNLDAETIGIWLWIVPKKFKDSTGQEFTVVLLDSEGIDSPSGFSDNRNFTLIVLLCSILIYNSSGVAGRSDLEQLDFIVKLSERIQLYTSKKNHQDEKDFYEAFPYFIWLLRDLILNLPQNCSNIREYFTKKVLNCKGDSNTEKSRLASQRILEYFSGFDAFGIPPPTHDSKVMEDLDGRKSEVNPEFHRQFELFRAFIHTKLSPKKAIKKGEFVTGEGLAALVQLYVDALNTPGAVPNVEESWDTFANTKCREVLEDALRTYQQEMTSFVENMMPCEADELRSAHEQTMEKCLETFKEETRFFSIDSVAPHLQELTGKTDILLFEWLQTNKQRTEESCKALIKELEKTILDPVLSRLVGPDGSQMDFNELVEAYKLIEQRYKDEGRGDLETKALAFVDMNSRLNDEMTRHWDILKKLKNYDALLAKEKTQKAKMEQEKERAKEEMKRLEKEQRDRQKELNMFYKKQEEDKIRMQEMYTKSLKDQREQMRNMMEANFEAQKKEREDALAHQKTIMDDYANMVKKNFEQRDQEIKLLREQMSAKEAQAKEDRDNMSRMYREKMEKDRKAAKENLEDAIKRIHAENKAEHEELKKEMEQNIDPLQQIKDYDESLAEEKAAKAALDDEKQKIEISEMDSEREIMIGPSTKQTITGKMERSLKEGFDVELMATLKKFLENTSCGNDIPPQQLDELRSLLNNACSPSWRSSIKRSQQDHPSLLDAFARAHSFVKPILEEYERLNTPRRGEVVDLTFLAHGGVCRPLLKCRLHYWNDEQIESINLYVPWGSKLDANAAYGIVTGEIKQHNIAFNGFFDEGQRLMEWNKLPRDNTLIPNVVFTRVSPFEDAWRNMQELHSMLQRQARGICVPFLPETTNIDELPLVILCVAVAVAGLQLNRKYRIHIASCLYPMFDEPRILVHPTVFDEVFPRVNCDQYWNVPISDRPVTMTMRFDTAPSPDVEKQFHILNDYLNWPF